ncbi:MAG: flagellar protein FlgN [Butyrivibrio sp.]|jgi:flagellar biosynthesis/type III secretory pathway chaperone|uniref:flagellar protein FlgN n=1 Tax=Butyrivibrio sp. NC2002 TaxID=1410610 RepID=UPI00056AA94D|nr:flagellar protein FlgN [Butyrivibrio sp. NC2002]MBE5859783.1 flagellar protein FlgN [Butyrivibrio sp.]
MASLLERLVEVLDKECKCYEKLLELSGKKTPVIMQRDLEALAGITEKEQMVVNSISAVDRERESIMKEIADILGEKATDMKLTDLVRMLDKRPKEQHDLAVQRDRLVGISANVQRVNGQNQTLLESSLEMIQYEMNIMQSARRAPETANYTKNAWTKGDLLAVATSGRFDAKQ